MNKQLREMTKCRWREFRREPSAIFWVIFMPIFWMLTLGFALSDKSETAFNVGWIEANSDHSSALELLQKDSKIELKVGDEDEIQSLNKLDRLLVLVKFEENGANLYFDKNNIRSATAASYVENILEKAAGRENVINFVHHDQLNPSRRYVDFLIPGLLALSILTTSLFGTAMTLVSNRRENLLKRYLATPMRPVYFFGSHILGRFMTLAVETSAILLAGWLIFGFPFWRNFFSLAALCILGAASFTALAILLASRIRDVASMSSIVKIITLPAMMLAGVFFPLSSFPFWLQPVLKFIPLTALVDGLRKITNDGQSIFQLHFEMGVLVTGLLIGLVGSLKFFRWE